MSFIPVLPDNCINKSYRFMLVCVVVKLRLSVSLN
jgi:hypothetical protein